MLLPPPTDPNKITLVLDLDETLVHSSFIPIQNPDFKFMLNAVPNPVPVCVLVRPHASEFLEVLGEKFELVVFTAANQPYADYVIDQIDKQKNVVHRLYKESCSDLNGATVKDLSLLNRDLKKIIIIDNSRISSLLQPYNSIPVNTWTEDKSDSELLQIAAELLPHANDDNVYSFLVQEEKNAQRKVQKEAQKPKVKDDATEDEPDNEVIDE